MAIKNIYDTEITASSFTWNGNTIATQAWVNANVGTPTLDAVTTAGSVTTNNIGVGLIELGGDTEHRLYRATTSLVKGTTTDTTILTGRTLDLYAYDDVNIRAGSGDNISFTAGGVSNAMYINSSGNVGIGTTSPDDKLDIENGRLRISNSTSGRNSTIGMDDGYNFYIKNTALGNLHLGNGTTTYVNGNLSVDNGVLFANATSNNVGIGTTSPGVKLDVNGSIRVTGRTAPTSGKGLEMFYYSPSDLFYLEAYDYTNFLYKAIRYVALSHQFITGNVGIGTTSPLGKLDVHTDGIYYTHNNAASRNWLTAANYLSFGDFAIVQSDAQGTNPYSPANSTPRLYISTSGNVGIGTTSPSTNLQTGDGSAGMDTSIRAYHSDGAYTEMRGYGIETNRTTAYIRPTGDKNAVMAFGNDGRTWNYVNVNTNYFVVATDTAEHMRITSAGNVGIGTTSPAVKLHVSGTGFEAMRLERTTAGGGVGLYLKNGNGVSWLAGNGGNNYFGINKSTDSFGAQFTITDTGNVGIGTASPGSKLTVVDAGNSLTFAQHSTSNIAELKIIGDAAHDAAIYFGDTVDNVRAGFYYDTSANQLQVRGYNNGTRMVVDSNGNVGIGTTSPGYTLDVNGSMHSTNITIADAIYHEGDTNTVIGFGTDAINLSTGGGVRATINNSGAKFNNDVVVVGGATLSLGERGEPDDLGRTVLLEGAANAGSGEGAGRIFFSEHNSTTASADNYGLSLYYEGDPNIALPSGFQPNQGNGTWALRRHNNSVNGDYIMSGSRTNSDVTFWGNLTVPNTIYHQDDSNTYMQFPANDTWIVATAGSERLRVTSAGNVGISASSPSQKLQVGSGSADDRIRVYYSDGAYSEQTGWGMEFARNASYLRPNNNNARTLNIGSSGLAWNGVNVESTNFTWNSNAVATQSWVTSQGYSTSSATVYTPDVYEWAQNVYGSNAPIDIGGQMVNGTTTTSQISPSEIQFTAAGTYMISWSLNWESLYNNRSVFGAGAYLNGFIIPGSSNLQYFRYNTYGHASTTNATFSVQVAAGDVISWRTLLHSGAANHATTPIGGDMGAITIHRIA